MADSEAKIILSAEDKASPVVQRAAQNFKDFQGTLVDINQYVGATGGSLSDMAAASTGAIGSIASLTAELKQLTAEFNALDPESAAFAQHAQDIQAVSGRLAELQGAARGGAGAMGQFNLATVAATAAGFSLANAAQTIVQGMVSVGKESLTAADDLNALIVRSQEIYGTDFPQMSRQADQLGQSFGRTSSSMLDSMTSLSMVTEGLGVGTQASEQMSVGLTKLAVDMGKAFHDTDENTMRAVERAMEGNARGLRQYDIVLTPHILQEYAHAEGIRVAVAAMTEEQKAILTYHFLMDKTSAIQKAAGRDTNDLSDSTKRLAAEWTKAEQNIGEVLLPTGSALIQMVTSWVSWFNAGAKAVGFFDDQAVRLGVTLHNLVTGSNDSMGPLGGMNFAGPKLTGKDLGLEDLQASLGKGGGWAAGWTDQSGKAGKAADALQQSLDALDTKYQDVTQSIQTKLNELDNTHQTKMQSMSDRMQTLGQSAVQLRATYEDQIQGVQDKLGQLKESFADTMDGITGKLEDAVGKQENKIDSLKQKLSDLQLRAAQENRRGSVSLQTNIDVERTQAELNKETAALDAFKAKGALTPDQLKAADAYAGKTDFERQTATIDAEKDKATQTYNKNVSKETQTEVKDRASYLDKAGKNQQEQQALKDKMALEQTAYGLERDQMIDTQQKLLTFSATHGAALQGMARVTKDSVAEMIEDLKKLGTAFSAATFQIQAKNLLRDGAAAGIARTIQLQTLGVN